MSDHQLSRREAFRCAAGSAAGVALGQPLSVLNQLAAPASVPVVPASLSSLLQVIVSEIPGIADIFENFSSILRSSRGNISTAKWLASAFGEYSHRDEDGIGQLFADQQQRIGQWSENRKDLFSVFRTMTEKRDQLTAHPLWSGFARELGEVYRLRVLKVCGLAAGRLEDTLDYRTEVVEELFGEEGREKMIDTLSQFCVRVRAGTLPQNPRELFQEIEKVKEVALCTTGCEDLEELFDGITAQLLKDEHAFLLRCGLDKQTSRKFLRSIEGSYGSLSDLLFGDGLSVQVNAPGKGEEELLFSSSTESVSLFDQGFKNLFGRLSRQVGEEFASFESQLQANSARQSASEGESSERSSGVEAEAEGEYAELQRWYGNFARPDYPCW